MSTTNLSRQRIAIAGMTLMLLSAGASCVTKRILTDDGGDGGGAGGQSAAGGSQVSGSTNGSGGAGLQGGNAGSGAGNSTGAGGTGIDPSSAALLGRACTSDSQCGALTCVTTAQGAASGNGIAGGLCTIACNNVAACQALTQNSACLGVGDKGYCVRACTPGTSTPAAAKCRGREDMACARLTMTNDGSPDAACVPICKSDASCGPSRYCNYGTGLCQNTPLAQTPFGTACDPKATTDTCGGGYCSCNDDTCTAGICTGLCAHSPSFDGCGGPENDGACFMATSADPGDGDLGLCGRLCNCSDDCDYPGHACVTSNIGNHRGVCLPPDNSPTEDVCCSCEGRTCGDNGCGASCGSCGGSDVCSGGNCCTPSCNGKACGDDGCGGSCGSCGANQACSAAGQCECVPSCDGKTCGDDGCGGTCGSCSGSQSCNNGNCCTPSCSGRECGSDGCGGTCGACEGNQECSGGSCCSPNCDGRTCGSNGCGGTCGTCWGQSSCVGGNCQCQPSCWGKTCGPDGCGGTCGVGCDFDESCNSGTCVSLNCGGDYCNSASNCCDSAPYCTGASAASATRCSNSCANLGQGCQGTEDCCGSGVCFNGRCE